MKHFSVLVFIFFTGISLLFPRVEIDEYIETFEIRENPGILFFIEHYRQRKDHVPVVFSFGDLEVTLPVKIDDPAAAGGIEARINEIAVGEIGLRFTIYEQNPVRTRIRLGDKSIPVLLKINREKKEAAFYIGNRPLKLSGIRVKYKEIAVRELYELTFWGTGVCTYKRFFLEPAAGVIYAVPSYSAFISIDVDKHPVWALKTYREESGGRQINRGGDK